MRAIFRQGLLITAMSLVLLWLASGLASAAAAANISRSYQANGSIQAGSIVSLVDGRSNYVEPASNASGTRLAGVAVASGSSLVAVDPETGKVQVAISGAVSLLASTVNGNVAVGDQVSASPFKGIGMKATPGDQVIGVAQTSLNAGTAGTQTEAVKDKTGHTQSIQVGYIRANIAVGATSASGSNNKLNVLQRMAKSLTGHTISTIRILLAMIIILVATVSLAALVYASIYGSIVSVGRNPLAKHAIFRTLTSVVAMSLLLTAVAVVAVFFLLR